LGITFFRGGKLTRHLASVRQVSALKKVLYNDAMLFC
jgi:hypothetical protein